MRQDLKFGLYYGVLACIWVLVCWAIGFDDADAPINLMWFSTLFYIIPIVFIVMGVRTLRRENGGYLKYGKGFLAGITIGFIGSLIYGLFSYIYQNLINTSYHENKIAQMYKYFAENPKMIALGNSGQVNKDELLQRSLESVHSPLTLVWGILGVFFALVFVSLIVAAIFRKEKPHSNAPTQEEIDQYLNDDMDEHLLDNENEAEKKPIETDDNNSNDTVDTSDSGGGGDD